MTLSKYLASPNSYLPPDSLQIMSYLQITLENLKNVLACLKCLFGMKWVFSKPS